MNQATLDIAEVIARTFGPCSLETARKVQDRMIQDGLDFSECSKREFREAAKLAWLELGN